MSEIRELQLEELKMLKLFAAICRENGLRYFLLGGTFLGAVRHKGFIPWDDDIDVALPRKDYDAFLKLADTTLPAPYQIKNYNRNTGYHYGWARIVNTQIRVMNYSANIPREEELWIDLIPLDGFPDPGMRRKMHKAQLIFWRSLNQLCQYDELVDQKRKRGRLLTLGVKVGAAFKWVGKILDYRVCLEHINRTLQKYPYDSDSVSIINFMASKGFLELYPRKSFREKREYLFEGDYYDGALDYDQVLTQVYGDYMKLPPEDSRNKHHLEILS